MEIKMARILKFNSDKAEEQIARMKAEVEEIDRHLANLVEYTVDWFRMLREKYGKQFPRRTDAASTSSRPPRSSRPTRNSTSTARRASSARA